MKWRTQSEFWGSSAAPVAQDREALLIFAFLLAEPLRRHGQRLHHRSFAELVGLFAPPVEIAEINPISQRQKNPAGSILPDSQDPLDLLADFSGFLRIFQEIFRFHWRILWISWIFGWPWILLLAYLRWFFLLVPLLRPFSDVVSSTTKKVADGAPLSSPPSDCKRSR